MNIFNPPKTEYNNYYDEARFNLTWKLNVFMVFSNFVLICALYFISFAEFLAAFYGWIVPVVYVAVLYKTRKYKILAIIYVVIGTFSTGLALLFVQSKFHLVELIFMIMIALYAYFTLGKKAGNLSIGASIIFVVVYLFTRLNSSLLLAEEITNVELFSLTFNFVVAFFLVGYLTLQFHKLNQHAENKYVESIKQLEETNMIVKSKDEEKTVMLKEIHHRVKNNLQVITSLLRLQSSEEDNPKVTSMFDDAIRRVMAMALIHDKMYSSDDLATLDLDDYLSSLSKDLIASYSVEIPVDVHVEAERLNISNKYFVPISLLCNELISNSLKHAFQDRKNGKIDVTLKSVDNNRLELIYKDNGSWKQPANNNSFGTELISSLVEQLNGELEKTSNETGTKYRFLLQDLGGI